MEHMAALSRWGRVALASRAALRTVLWFAPGPMRSRPLALGDLLAIDTCNTLGMLAAASARQLSPPVTAAATNAAMSALAAPGRIPLLPTDHAAMLAGLTVEWAGTQMAPDALDTGNLDNARAALSDLHALLSLGMQERGYEYPVPQEFFSRPLWPAPAPDLRQEMAQWENILASYNLLEMAERFRNLTQGLGMDWGDAQRRAEAWVRMSVRATDVEAAPAQAAPPAASRFAAYTPPPSEPQPIVVPPIVPPTAPPASFVPPPAYVPPPAPFPPAAPVVDARSYAAPSATPAYLPASYPTEQPAPPTPAWKTPLTEPLRPGPKPVVRAAPEPVDAAAPPTFRVPDPGASPSGFGDLEPCANALASFIDSLDPRSPFILAIQGPSGSGRSVLGGMLQRRLAAKPSCRSDEPHLTLWFQANQERNAPSITGLLMRDLAAALDRERRLRERHVHRLAWGLQPKLVRLKYAFVIAGLVLAALSVLTAFGLMIPGLPSDLVATRRDMLEALNLAGLGKGLSAVAAVGVMVLLASLLELFGFIAPCGRALASYVQHPSTGELEARNQLGDLLRTGVPEDSRMVVFVENLESAGVERSREFLAAMKTTLRFPQLVFVLLADAKALAAQSDDPDEPRSRTDPPLSLNGTVDLQVDLPARPVAGSSRRGKDGSGSTGRRVSVGHAKGLAAFWGPWSRDWRGGRRLVEVFQRTMYVDPPYLAPVVMLSWFFFWLPIAAFTTLQKWIYPPRGQRVFTMPKTTLLNVLLTIAALGHGALVFQTINGLLTSRHFVIMYPDAAPQSIWIFLPMEVVILALILLFGAWTARSGRDQERKALQHAREALRTQVAQTRANGETDPLQAAAKLKGVSQLPAGEDLLIREALVEAYLASERDPLARFSGMMRLASGLAA
jgi:hypothetical protein